MIELDFRHTFERGTYRTMTGRSHAHSRILAQAGDLSPIHEVVEAAWESLHHLEASYPGFCTWYWTKVIPGVGRGERKILISRLDTRVAGVAITKRDCAEAKLCTLWVAPTARATGVGRELMQAAIGWLGNEAPLFTVPAERIDEFRPLLKRFKFEETDRLGSAYRPGVTEHVFNGRLQSASIS
tara:strand:+ start:1289 stop:1840 length:552 start_codon:yes stop_codon:yes gene_type:complete